MGTFSFWGWYCGGSNWYMCSLLCPSKIKTVLFLWLHHLDLRLETWVFTFNPQHYGWVERGPNLFVPPICYPYWYRQLISVLWSHFFLPSFKIQNWHLMVTGLIILENINDITFFSQCDRVISKLFWEESFSGKGDFFFF